MKTKKLFLIIALVVGCAVGAHAQKTVFKFRDAQARAGDAVTEVCVKPTVVEVKILEDKGRIKDEWTLSKEEVEIAMKGELDNIRAWGTYLSTIKYNCDVIMGATFKVEDEEYLLLQSPVSSKRRQAGLLSFQYTDRIISSDNEKNHSHGEAATGQESISQRNHG